MGINLIFAGGFAGTKPDNKSSPGPHWPHAPDQVSLRVHPQQRNFGAVDAKQGIYVPS
jgi:hypothetical protein